PAPAVHPQQRGLVHPAPGCPGVLLPVLGGHGEGVGVHVAGDGPGTHLLLAVRATDRRRADGSGQGLTARTGSSASGAARALLGRPCARPGPWRTSPTLRRPTSCEPPPVPTRGLGPRRGVARAD